VRQATEVALVYTPYGEKPADASTDRPHNDPPQDRTQNARLESPSASATAHTERLKTDPDHATAGQIQGAADATRLVLDPDPNLQRRGADWLAKNDVDPAQRGNVLAALKLMLNEPDGRRRLSFVQGYARWADSTRIADLAAVIDYPEKPQGLSGHETCWAAAMVGLVRLDADAANRAVEKRINNFFFRVDTTRFLKPLAEGTGPEKQTAAAIIERLKNPPKR
jgi:hypothetical protein